MCSCMYACVLVHAYACLCMRHVCEESDSGCVDRTIGGHDDEKCKGGHVSTTTGNSEDSRQ